MHVLETYPARRAVPVQRAGARADLPRHRQPVRAAPRARLRATRPVPALLLVPAVRAARPLQHAGPGTHRAHPARRAARHRPRVAGADLRIDPRAAAHAGAHRPRSRGNGRCRADRDPHHRGTAHVERPSARRAARQPRRPTQAAQVAARFASAFPAAYQEEVSRSDAIGDIEELRRCPRSHRRSACSCVRATPARRACTCGSIAAAIRSRCRTCCRCSRISTCAC